MATERCPVCGGVPSRYLVDNLNLEFLRSCADNSNINKVISLARIAWSSLPELRLDADSKMIIEGVSSNMLKAVQVQINEVLKPAKLIAEKLPELIYKLPTEMDKNVSEKIDEIKIRLTKEFRETLSTMGFPEPEQMKLLSQLIPSVLPLLQELLRLQKVPLEKGKAGELKLLEELKDYFPEDDYKYVGGPGDTDIIATPRYGGFQLSHKILIESKRNNSGWSKVFVDKVRRHMRARGNHFAILVVEVMPRGARGFLTEHFGEGAILITGRKNACIAYGTLRSVFIATYPFEVNVADLQRLLADKKIENAVKDAMHYQEYLRKVRTKAARIISNAKSIIETSDELDAHLRKCLKELQNRIKDAVKEIAEAKPSVHVKKTVRTL